MSKPIQAGDLCEVISGMLGDKSPNIGLIVTVVSFVGDHSKYGRIWRCEAEYAERGQIPTVKVPGEMSDFSQHWLRKIEPPKTSKTSNTDKEVTA